MNIVKTVQKRDSAVTILRKLGCPKTDYDTYITKTADGLFAVRVGDFEASIRESFGKPVTVSTEQVKKVEKARAALKTAVEAKKREVKKVEAKKAAADRTAPVAKASPDENQSQYIRRLIRAGYTNQQVWVAFAQAFNAGPNTKYFPSWYRWTMRKAGEKV